MASENTGWNLGAIFGAISDATSHAAGFWKRWFGVGSPSDGGTAPTPPLVTETGATVGKSLLVVGGVVAGFVVLKKLFFKTKKKVRSRRRFRRRRY